jgi:hypothetical protein
MRFKEGEFLDNMKLDGEKPSAGLEAASLFPAER